ncbi:hypothetical protein D3C81_2190160 [compost metagenome]
MHRFRKPGENYARCISAGIGITEAPLTDRTGSAHPGHDRFGLFGSFHSGSGRLA